MRTLPFAYGTDESVLAVTRLCNVGLDGTFNCGWNPAYVGTCTAGDQVQFGLTPGSNPAAVPMLLQVQQGVHARNYPFAPGGLCWADGIKPGCNDDQVLGADISGAAEPSLTFTCPSSGIFSAMWTPQSRADAALVSPSATFTASGSKPLTYPAGELDAFPRGNIEGYFSGNIFGPENIDARVTSCESRPAQAICAPTGTGPTTGTSCEAGVTNCCVPCQRVANPLFAQSGGEECFDIDNIDCKKLGHSYGYAASTIVVNTTGADFAINHVQFEGPIHYKRTTVSVHPVHIGTLAINGYNFKTRAYETGPTITALIPSQDITLFKSENLPDTTLRGADTCTDIFGLTGCTPIAVTGNPDTDPDVCIGGSCKFHADISPPVIVPPGGAVAIELSTISFVGADIPAGSFTGRYGSAAISDATSPPHYTGSHGCQVLADGSTSCLTNNFQPNLVVGGFNPASPSVIFPNAHMWLSSSWGNPKAYYRNRSCSSDQATCISTFEGTIDTGPAPCSSLGLDLDTSPLGPSARPLKDVGGCSMGNFEGGTPVPLTFNDGDGAFPAYGVTTFLPNYTEGIESPVNLRCAAYRGLADLTPYTPAARANAAPIVCAGDQIMLDAAGSKDPDRGNLTYEWKERSGAFPALSGKTVTLAAPRTGAQLTFDLTVKNDCGLTNTATVGIAVRPNSNRAPIAAISGESTRVGVQGSFVFLDAGASADPDGDPLTWTWNQIGGPDIGFGTQFGPQANFYLPPIEAGTLLTFQVDVTDQPACAAPLTASQIVTVRVQAPDQPPVANAGVDQAVSSSALVTLDGSGSFDPDQDPIVYLWSQAGGTPVALSDASAARPTFVAPSVQPGQPETLTFQLVVVDSYGLFSGLSFVNVVVSRPNRPPVAATTGDLRAMVGDLVTLDGSPSSDPDGDPLTYTWVQLSGVPAVLSSAWVQSPSFTAPDFATTTSPILSFQLTVADPYGGLSAAATVNVVLNHRPVAAAGVDQTVTSGALVTLDGSGSVDPDGQAITYTWTQSSGPAVTLSNAHVVKPTFTAPTVTTATNQKLIFQLSVTDSAGASSTVAAVGITVRASGLLELKVSAGPDLTVCGGAAVTLDASYSSDPNAGGVLSFSWLEIAGTAVTLDRPTAQKPKFTAPLPPVGGSVLTFQLNARDNLGKTGAATVNVNVKHQNRPPTADANLDQVVIEGAHVVLDGSKSFDPDGDALAYSWVQVDGPPVRLSNPNAARPEFDAPFIDAGGSDTSRVLTFSLTVTDVPAAAECGVAGHSSDLVRVTVENVNHPPVARAGSPLVVSEGSIVRLNGSASSDPDGDALRYAWTQTAGNPVALLESNTAYPIFLAPWRMSQLQVVLTFQLTVSDRYGGSSSGTVNVTVKDVPPDCTHARPSSAVLWPPDRRMVGVGIRNVSDPDEPVTIKVTRVRQDEPVKTAGDDETGPDAVIAAEDRDRTDKDRDDHHDCDRDEDRDAPVLIRAERASSGNGRVYTIDFTATDRAGASCTGTVKVAVPKTSRDAAVDNGPNYTSTAP